MDRVKPLRDRLSGVNKRYGLNLRRGDVLRIGDRDAIVHGAVDWWIRIMYVGKRSFDYIDPTTLPPANKE